MSASTPLPLYSLRLKIDIHHTSSPPPPPPEPPPWWRKLVPALVLKAAAYLATLW